MRRTIMGLVISLISIQASAQAPAPRPLYLETTSVLDSSGDLYIFESGSTIAAMTTTTSMTSTMPQRGPRLPKTRITLLRPTGAAQTAEYDASFRVVGVGSLAVYAEVSAYSQTAAGYSSTHMLVAIPLNQTLPGLLSALPSMQLTGASNVTLGPADYLAITTALLRPVPLGPPQTATTTPRPVPAPRQAQTVRFNGTSFVVVNSTTLP